MVNSLIRYFVHHQSNNFPWWYSVEFTAQAWNKAKISPYTPLKTALSKRKNHSPNYPLLIGRISGRTSPVDKLTLSEQEIKIRII